MICFKAYPSCMFHMIVEVVRSFLYNRVFTSIVCVCSRGMYMNLQISFVDKGNIE